jgi:putative flippase GtrA
MNVYQPLRFGLVGGLATLVHISVGVTLIWMSVPPLLANLLAFLTALGVSFWGHYSYSFEGHSRTVIGAFQRFFLIAVSAFSINEALLAMFLAAKLAPPAASLFMSTATVALFTFVFSKHWAFRGS